MELATLMTIDIAEYGKDYVTKEDLNRQYAEVDIEDFYQRKYNQVSHLKNLFGKLDDLTLRDNILYFKTDAINLFGSDTVRKDMRDPYLQRVYKTELEEESCTNFDTNIAKCMVEGLSYPVLIASHIKPYSHCKNDEPAQFDVNNGLLLSKNMDSLFDLGYMTFDDYGCIIPSKDLKDEIVNYLSHYRLLKEFINPKRMEYMKYHRKMVFEKRYSTSCVKRYVLQEPVNFLAAEETP